MGSFLEELKRRRVVRMAVVYLAVAFAVLQGADVIVPALRLPDWMITAVAVLAVLGFPLALSLAWALDVTPDGVRRTTAAEATAGAPTSQWLGRRTIIVALILLAAGGLAGWLAGRAGGRAGSGEIDELRSIAVLPFADMSPERDMEYFGDGMAEEILNVLAKLDGLRVAGRTSSFSFKGKDVDVRTIGETLNVSTVLEGSVRRSGSRLRVTAQLLRVTDQSHLWSEVFERSFNEDVFDIQDAISRAIVEALEIRLTGRGASTVANRGTSNLEAYNAWLLGRHQWNRREPAANRAAIASLNRAIALDSSFARAWASLSDAYQIGAAWYWIPLGEALPIAREGAERAIALDPTLADGYAALGGIRMSDHEWDAAERAFRRAIELDAGHAFARYWYSDLLDAMNRPDEALREVLRAREIDPLALQIANGVGTHYSYVREFDRAVSEYRAILAADPGFQGARRALVICLTFAGRFPEALTEYEALPASYHHPAMRAVVLAGLGRRGEAEALLEEAGDPVRTPAVDHMTMAHAWSLLDRFDIAIQWLERAVERRDSYVYNMGSWTRLLPRLAAQPGYQAIMRRVGLDRYWMTTR